MDSSSSIMEMEVEISKVIEDVRERINKVFDMYTDDSKNIPKLPDFDDLIKSNKLHYETSKTLTDCIDELLEVKVRVSVTKRGLQDLMNIQTSSRSDYTLIMNFKNSMKKFDEELDGYRFELIDLIKNANNKLRVLESVSFYNGEV